MIVPHRVGQRQQAPVRHRHPDQFGLPAVQPRIDARVPEQGAPLALSRTASPAVPAGSVRHHAGAHHPLADPHALHGCAHVGHRADELVPEHGRIVKPRRQAVDGKQVRPADRGGRHLHHCVSRIMQPRFGNVGHPDRAGLSYSHRFQPGSSISTRYPSGSTQKKRLPPHGGWWISARNGTPLAASSAWAACASVYLEHQHDTGPGPVRWRGHHHPWPVRRLMVLLGERDAGASRGERGVGRVVVDRQDLEP